MNRKLILACGLVVILTAFAFVSAQEPDAPVDDPAAKGSLSGLVDDDVDVSGIEQILRGEEEVLEGRIFNYDPAGRRDPFRSLLEGFRS